MSPNVKKILTWGSAIGISGGVVVTVLVFAMDAYVGRIVDTKIKTEMAKVPTTIAIDAKLTNIEDGIGDNATAIAAVKISQDEFKLLFIDYLQNEANR